MSASADIALKTGVGGQASYPVTAATTIYEGSMVGVSVGYAIALTDGARFVGHAIKQANNSAGAAGDINVECKSGIYDLQVTLDNVNVYMIGAYVYAVDDNTYTLAPMETPVGRVKQYVTTDTAIVEFDTNLTREKMGGVNGIFEPFRLAPLSQIASNGSTLVSLDGAKIGSPWLQTLVDGGGDAAQKIQALTSARGGAYCGGLELVTNDAENDGVTLTLNGKSFYLDAATRPVFFGVKIAINDVTQSDFFLGLATPDTTLLAGNTDNISLRSADGAATVTCVVEKDNTETTSSSIGTIVDDTEVALGFIYDGTYVYPYVNGVAGTALAVTNLPDNEKLTPSIEFLTGEGVAQTLKIRFMDAYQIA